MSDFVKWNCIGMILTFFISISVPQTCSDYKSRTKSNSGYFLIDPEQKKGGTTKFVVYCDFENGKSFWLFSLLPLKYFYLAYELGILNKSYGYNWITEGGPSD